MTDSSVPSSPGFDEETRTYMQSRLRLLSGSVTAITGVLTAAFLATLWQSGDDGPAVLVPSSARQTLLLFGAVGVAAAASRVNLGLRRRGYDAGHLGQYEIKAKIGAGAMGEVYRATHSMLRRPTAVKLLRTDIAGSSSLRRFEIREYLRLHQTKQPDPPSQRNPAVPADLEEVILRGLSKDPGRRPKNAATLRAQLLACEAAGAWGTREADAWWAGFEKPSILDETTSSTGSPSVFATALIGEATALLLDSEKLRELDKLPES